MFRDAAKPLPPLPALLPPVPRSGAMPESLEPLSFVQGANAVQAKTPQPRHATPNHHITLLSALVYLEQDLPRIDALARNQAGAYSGRKLEQAIALTQLAGAPQMPELLFRAADASAGRLTLDRAVPKDRQARAAAIFLALFKHIPENQQLSPLQPDSDIHPTLRAIEQIIDACELQHLSQNSVGVRTT